MEFLIVQGRIENTVTDAGWKSLTNKIIYVGKVDSFPKPAIESKSGIDFGKAWHRIHLAVLEPVSRDISYLAIHNKLPVQERLFRIRLSNDPYCPTCPGADICDLLHFFCNCTKVSTVWKHLHQIINAMLGVEVENRDIINYMFPKSSKDKEVVWLIGNYLATTWNELYVRGKDCLKYEEFFGYLTFKYKADQQGARHSLSSIPGLL